LVLICDLKEKYLDWRFGIATRRIIKPELLFAHLVNEMKSAGSFSGSCAT